MLSVNMQEQQEGQQMYESGERTAAYSIKPHIHTYGYTKSREKISSLRCRANLHHQEINCILGGTLQSIYTKLLIFSQF